MIGEIEGRVVESLKTLVDDAQANLLDQVITAAEDMATNPNDESAGMITLGGRSASIEGTAGVAMIEFEKSAIQNVNSNLSGTGANNQKLLKLTLQNTKG